MPFEQLTSHWPALAIAGGMLLGLLSQRTRIASLASGLVTPATSKAQMTPDERFATLYALRTWCEAAGHAEAVQAIDSHVLPTIVRTQVSNQGGPNT